MIEKWSIVEPEDGDIKRCVLCIPGRGNSTEFMMRIGSGLAIPNTLIVSVRSFTGAWYPQPKSSYDQNEAVLGLPVARTALMQSLARIRRAYNLKFTDISLLGFSAGGVMALQLAMHSGVKFASSVCLCGAILEPEKVPKAKNPTPIMLVHNQDDSCFDWWERYVPMKKALIENGYNPTVLENKDGEHMVYAYDVFHVSKFIGRNFGIKDWLHPRYRTFVNHEGG